VAGSISITGSPQAGKTPLTITGSGFTSGQVLALLVTDPEYGSNWTTPDGTAVTQARSEQNVKCDSAGAFTVSILPTFAKQYTYAVRPITEQYETTTAISSATNTPTGANT
jgi:hypothetical protein